MQFVSDTEANQAFAVIMSIEDYQRITRINIQEFQQLRESIGRKAQERGLTEDKLNELLSNDQ
jgi:hypothetical protein